MRDILFRNLTSADKRRRIISSSEIVDKQGIHSVVNRHFIYIVKEIKDIELKQPQSSVYVLKARRTKEQQEKFLCRIKGSVFASYNGKLYLILFMHSLKIDLTTSCKN